MQFNSPHNDTSYSHYEEKQAEHSAKWSGQSDVVIPDKLDNGDICNGLLRRFVAKISYLGENSPHNDMSRRHAEGAQATEASHNF